MQTISNLSKTWGTRILALLVLGLTSMVLVNATITISVPNAVSFPFNIPAGSTMTIGVPAIDRPILFMGATTTVGDRGVGHVSLLRANAAPGFLMWVGQESQPTAITQGFSATAGTHIVYIDFSHLVNVTVNNATSIRIRNAAGSARAGVVTMIF